MPAPPPHWRGACPEQEAGRLCPSGLLPPLTVLTSIDPVIAGLATSRAQKGYPAAA
ncbi:hypothetical protein Arub01_54010 [Actinomadura rubrobrunea]|uniref:Uncharacterized protein n=1 Tax=Actinomadura rubrobrunea TaxID=115335 RepID=A0A9W6UYF4_9ACTN|nr:hypothetical protein Arub01_54010 [Actinomadura rubrobrunea]